MPTDLLQVAELTPPDGMDAIGVLQALVERGDVVLVLDGTDQPAGFYPANYGEHDELLGVPPEFRWTVAAKLGADRLRNRGDSVMRELNVDDVMPAHVRKVEVPSLESLLGKE
jgi:hypothetical protein